MYLYYEEENMCIMESKEKHIKNCGGFLEKKNYNNEN